MANKHAPGTFVSQRSAIVTFTDGEGPWAEFVNWLESNGHWQLALDVHQVLPKFLAEPRAYKAPSSAVMDDQGTP